MTDVVEIAKKRRDALAAEIGKLDDFVCMAEKLVEDGGDDAEEEHGSSSTINLFADADAAALGGAIDLPAAAVTSAVTGGARTTER